MICRLLKLPRRLLAMWKILLSRLTLLLRSIICGLLLRVCCNFVPSVRITATEATLDFFVLRGLFTFDDVVLLLYGAWYRYG